MSSLIKYTLTNKLAFFLFLFAICFYIYNAFSSYAPIFYEDQFIHIDFIRDLAAHKLNLKNFFSVFGEHLFPGYSIIVAINYFLFSINLYFESTLTVIFNLVSASIAYYFYRKLNPKTNNIFLFPIFFILLSPAQYLMKSMALAANLSVILFIAIFYLILKSKKIISTYSLLFIYIIGFAGAYSVGFIVAYAFYLLICFKQSHSLKKIDWPMTIFILACFLLYYFILYWKGNGQAVSAHTLNFFRSLDFGIIMFGSSILGKALYEATQNFTIYYIAGLMVIAASSASLYYSFIQLTKLHTNELSIQKKDSVFIFLLALVVVYSITIISVASYARFTNGKELAMGQWYQHHIKFLPVFSLILLGYFHPQKITIKLFAFALTTLAIIGYYYEYRKIPYAKQWYLSINSHIPDYLTLRAKYSDPGAYSYFYWPNDWTKNGLQFFYKNKLAYFKEPLIFGLTSDSWNEENKLFQVVCPVDSKNISINIGKTNALNFQFFNKQYNAKISEENIFIEYKFQDTEFKIFEINNKNLVSFPESKVDIRKLYFHVKNVMCY